MRPKSPQRAACLTAPAGGPGHQIINTGSEPLEQAAAERLQREPPWPLRDELLNETLLRSLPDAREKPAAWRQDDNEARPTGASATSRPRRRHAPSAALVMAG